MGNLAELRLRSDGLYEKYLTADPGALNGDAEFALAASRVVGELQENARQATYREDYDWIRQALEKWRVVFVAALGQAEEIDIPLPDRPLEAASRRIVWRSADIEAWVRARAFALAKDRAILKESQKRAEEILRENPSTGMEQDEDWILANVYLASDVLDRSPELTSLPPSAYEQLEKCWLEDIKRLRAYLRWTQRGAGSNEGLSTDDWQGSCDDVWALIVRGGAKLPISMFDPVRHYLMAMYLPEGRMDEEKLKPAIAAKATRLWQEGSADDVLNWVTAEGYVRQFYGNILAAVEGDAGACRQVAVAVDVCDDAPGQPKIINAFEAAVTAGFVEISATRPSRAAVA